MGNEQVVHDLENLMGEVDVGWYAMYSGEVFGEGGCLLREMNRMLRRENPGLPIVRWCPRKQAMLEALGFTRPQEMYVWNDRQTHPDAIKARIKDALEKLG